MLKNPMSDKDGTRHVRNRLVGEICGLKIVNGSELGKYERRDYEIYFLRWAFQEYFRVFETDHDNYVYDEFIPWVTVTFPNVLKLIEEYECPYPQ